MLAGNFSPQRLMGKLGKIGEEGGHGFEGSFIVLGQTNFHEGEGRI